MKTKLTKPVNQNNHKAWLFKIMGYQPVTPLDSCKYLIQLAIRDGR